MQHTVSSQALIVIAFSKGAAVHVVWDEMVYYLDAACGSGSSSISLTLRDHTSVSALQRTWGPGAEEYGTLGTIPYPSEEYTLTLTFTGDSDLRLIIAGAITFSWTL